MGHSIFKDKNLEKEMREKLCFVEDFPIELDFENFLKNPVITSHTRRVDKLNIFVIGVVLLIKKEGEDYYMEYEMRERYDKVPLDFYPAYIVKAYKNGIACLGEVISIEGYLAEDEK